VKASNENSMRAIPTLGKLRNEFMILAQHGS